MNWHYGFGAAGVGMTLGLIQYVVGQRHLAGAGQLKEDSGQPERIAAARRQFGIGLAVATLLVGIVATLSLSGALPVTVFAESVFYLVTALFAAYFAIVIFFLARNSIERQRLTVCFLLSLGAAMFWSGFEQAGSALSLFARDLTDRTVGGREITAGALQSVNPILIILLAPVVGALWVKLGARNPSIGVKFGLGLVLACRGEPTAPPPADARVQELIRQLDSDDYKARQEAARLLGQMAHAEPAPPDQGGDGATIAHLAG